MCTLPSPRKKLQATWWVGHVLVLVFDATRRHLALRAPALVGERAGRHVVFLKFMFIKPSYTVQFHMRASKVNGNLHDMTIF